MLHNIHQRRLAVIAIVFISSWVLGTFFIHRFEAGHPLGESYFNAFYFTVITTATIGFGDLVPMTVAGKVLTMCYAIFYVPLFLYTMTLLFQIKFEKLRLQDALLEAEIRNLDRDIHSITLDKPHHAQARKKQSAI